LGEILMEEVSFGLLDNVVVDDSLRIFSHALVFASVSAAFLQELVFGVKAKYQRGELKHPRLHAAFSVLGMATAFYALFLNPFGERYVVAGIAAVFWVLFEVKKKKGRVGGKTPPGGS
tara:strand:+ start:1312 stop:1665 length:354 start_codon:yes stop_codon:yes gene_type:complete